MSERQLKQRFSPRVKAINEDGSVRFVYTEKKVDRYGEVVMPGGVILDNYEPNPIILFGHGWGSEQSTVPIGKTKMESMDVTEQTLEADVLFDEQDEFAAKIGNKVRNGFLNAGSIGFYPKVISNEPELPKQSGVTITEWELLEFSIVPVPALPSALAQREFNDLRKEIGDRFGKTAIRETDMLVNKFYGIDVEDEMDKGGILDCFRTILVSFEGLEQRLDAVLDRKESAAQEEVNTQGNDTPQPTVIDTQTKAQLEGLHQSIISLQTQIRGVE